MQWNKSLLCSVVFLFLLCFCPLCTSTEKHSRCRSDTHTQIHHKTHNTKKFCDPSFSNQTAHATTQKCISGFYREQTGPHRGQCVPCSCNGLSNECNEHTGNCMDCQFNTTGDHCEQCKEGYYGNAADRTCHACPCPSTRNNFALACLDIGSGVVECLCKRGYSGARCDRCAFGYYGNPIVDGGSCKPCSCEGSTLNICDSLTGECDSCTLALLVDLEKMNKVLAQQKQNITNGPGSLPRLNHLQANISATKFLVGSHISAVTHLQPEVEQLEANVDVVGEDFSQLIDEAFKTVSAPEVVLENMNGTKLKAENLISEAEALLTVVQDLIRQLTEVKHGESETLSENKKSRMIEEAQRIVQEMRERGCTAHRDKAGRAQEEAHTLLDIIRNMTDFLLREVTELLSDTEDTVNKTQGLNLKSCTMLQHLEHLHTQLEREQSTLLPMTEMTKVLLKNITDIFLMLEEIKKEFENDSAQLDGGKLQLAKKLNSIFLIKAKVDIVTRAEKHAEELNRVAVEFQQVLNYATNSNDLLIGVDIGANDNIRNLIEKAEMAANQSWEAVAQALKEGGLANKAKGLNDDSTDLRTEASETQGDLKCA